jgi:SNF2 family DNA or RNA helicase
MTDGQARIYSRVRDHYRASILATIEQQGLNRSRIKILEGLLRLRQAANHPALIGENDAGSGKLDNLMTLIKKAISGGHKALVFSQFTKMLGIIRRSLDDAGIIYEYLDGRTPQARRKDRVRNFQDNEDIKLFLISLKAGGLGLNLTAADYVFIVDPWWNPAVELQAVDRTHRIGQDKKVFTYRFITAETVEEKVLALQEKKRELVSAILSGGQDMLRQLSREDLDLLFS